MWKVCEEDGHRKLYSRRKRCISSFNSLAKVKNQNPQSAIMQKWKFSFLLNMLKYYKNGETKFLWNCIVSFFNNFRDVKVSSHYHYVLAPQISWYLTLFTTRETFSNFRICSFWFFEFGNAEKRKKTWGEREWGLFFRNFFCWELLKTG